MPQDARTHANLSVQFAAEGRWTEALHEAHVCHRLAEPGSVLALWALHMLACTYVDAGLPRQARPYAVAYLRQAYAYPKLEKYTPYVVRAMGHVAYQERRFKSALLWFTCAKTLFSKRGDALQAAVSSHNMAWAFVRAGHPRMARLVLADREEFTVDLAYLHDSAMSAILGEEGQHEEAIMYGRSALATLGRRSHDFVDAAEVALVLSRAHRHLRQNHEASALLIHAADFAALQGWSLSSVLTLSERAGGGDSPDTAASTRGSANLLHRGCYTSGLA